MAIHRAVFEITADDFGNGYDDVTLRMPTTPTRNAFLKMVTVEREEAGFANLPAFCFTERKDVSTETWNASDEDYQPHRQLFYVDMSKSNPSIDTGEVAEFDPRHLIVDSAGALPTYDVLVGELLIHHKYIRCSMTNATDGDVFTVVMYYETAGDYRF